MGENGCYRPQEMVVSVSLISLRLVVPECIHVFTFWNFLSGSDPAVPPKNPLLICFQSFPFFLDPLFQFFPISVIDCSRLCLIPITGIRECSWCFEQFSLGLVLFDVAFDPRGAWLHSDLLIRFLRLGPEDKSPNFVAGPE